MLKQQNQWPRKVAALVCLVAVLLLQAPFARAAWISSAMGCCMGDHCPIPGHHHKSASTETEMPMDCGHNMGKMSDCKISCCKTTDETAISIEPFVLPHVLLVLSLSAASPDASHFVSQMISRSEKPQSPPPKSLPS